MSFGTRTVFVLVGLLTLFATVVARLSTGESRAAVSSTLHAAVGPGYTISLTFDDGEPVTATPAGTYRILVTDQGIEHNFHLSGPGVDEFTSVEGLASTTWTVTFRNNTTYYFVCDPHPDSMAGQFTVGNAAATSSSGGGGGSSSGSATQGKATGKAPVMVLARIDRSGKLALTLAGKPLKTLPAGTYRFAITDASARDDVTLRRVGGRAKTLTGVSFTGRRTVSTELATGLWRLYSSPREPAGAVVFRVTNS